MYGLGRGDVALDSSPKRKLLQHSISRGDMKVLDYSYQDTWERRNEKLQGTTYEAYHSSWLRRLILTHAMISGKFKNTEE